MYSDATLWTYQIIPLVLPLPTYSYIHISDDETETSPVAYNIAVWIAMTWMTEPSSDDYLVSYC